MHPSSATLYTLDSPLVLPLVPPPARSAIIALAELDRALLAAGQGAREPTLRQIRLRWWADQLAGLRAGDRRPDPTLTHVANALLPALVEPASRDALAAWAAEHDEPAERGAGLFALAATLLGGNSDAASGALWGRVAAALTDAEPRWADLSEASRRIMPSSDPRALAVMTAQAKAVAARHGRPAPLRDQWISLRVGLVGR